MGDADTTRREAGDAEAAAPSAGAETAADPRPAGQEAGWAGAEVLMPGFIELMERTQREAFELHQEARRVLAQAQDEASRTRAAAASDASLMRDRAVAETEWLRRDHDRLWATFSRFLATAAELVNVLAPLVSTRSEAPPGGPAPDVIETEPVGAVAPSTPPPTPSPRASEADLLAAEQQLRGMLDKTRQYFRTN